METKDCKIKRLIKNYGWLSGTMLVLLILICFMLLLIPESQMPTILQSNGLVAIISAFLGVVMTVAVTSALLEKQAETQKELLDRQFQSEAEKERSMKVFEKRQEVYHDFLDNLKAIIQHSEIRIGVKKENGEIDRTVDDLRDLIFQLSYLQMHTSEKTINDVLDEMVKMIQCLNEFGFTQEKDKQKESSDFYSSLSNTLFTIVSILKKDLYDKVDNPITKEKMDQILNKCDLVVETKDFDKYEVQEYFWNELRKQLSSKGYTVDMEYSFKHDVKEYYARARNRHRNYGIGFEIYKMNNGNSVAFYIGISNTYQYGFEIPGNTLDKELEQFFKEKMSGYKSDVPYWYGFKSPSPDYQLDFWKLDSPGFDRLKHKNKREKYIAEIADEMDCCIKDFLAKAKKEEL
jgi:hypothetical protein